MKKINLLVATILTILFALTGCMKAQNEVVKQPDVTQIRSICNLATLECYYHNVARSEKNAPWYKKDREFWIEYTGIAKIGIDMSKVNIEINGENITVFLPDAQLLGDTICENDINQISSSDGWIKNKITADDQTAAIKSAQEEMSESIKNNRSLLLNAQDRAKELIENYINKLGEISNIEYQIDWVYENSNKTIIEEAKEE